MVELTHQAEAQLVIHPEDGDIRVLPGDAAQDFGLPVAEVGG